MRHPDAKGKPVAAIDICVDNLQVGWDMGQKCFTTSTAGIDRDHDKLISAIFFNRVHLL